MKTFLTLITFLSASSAFAGNGSGTMGAMRFIGDKAQAIYDLGKKNDLSRFAYGELVDGKWQVQEIEMLTSDLLIDTEAVKALELSKAKKSWVGLGN